MAEIPNLNSVGKDFKVFLDQDDTLAPSNAFSRLYEVIGASERLEAEREHQRKASREAAKSGGTLIVPPYDIVEHLGPNPDPSYGVEIPYNLSPQDIMAMALRARESQPNPLFPDARRLLARLAIIGITPTILTYGDDFTQRLKAALNGLDIYPIEVVNKLKPEYLADVEGLGILVEDRIKHLPKIGESQIAGVLYDRNGNHPDFEGVIIKSHDELFR
ncbi:MAG TPA: hypothetical protein VLA77_02480 [Candidatus Saccharimonadales bacterium]|nr:hypothetical protein [Candidatus Saccharimonadales bacterium]